MAKTAAEIAGEIEQILRADCNSMVFPLRVDTLEKISQVVGDYGTSRWEAGQDSGLTEGYESANAGLWVEQ